jgi:hypothetical protein
LRKRKKPAAFRQPVPKTNNLKHLYRIESYRGLSHSFWHLHPFMRAKGKTLPFAQFFFEKNLFNPFYFFIKK